MTALATLVLIGLGGLVTSHGAGLAVPDWPNSYGYNMFFFPVSYWMGGIFYEHSHRLWASGVGLMTGVLALWLHGPGARPLMRWLGIICLGMAGVTLALKPSMWQDVVVLALTGAGLLAASTRWPSSEPAPRWLRRLGVIAFVLVVVQGILGGLRVTALKDEIGIFHAVLAQLFLCLLCSIALFTSRTWERLTTQVQTGGSAASVSGGLRARFTILAVLILAQLAIGGAMRHAHAGLAIPDFPKAHGQWWPDTSPEAVQGYNRQRLEVTAAKPITGGQILLQMTHRLMALAILAGAAVCAWNAARQLGNGHAVSKLAFALLGLVVVQAALGAWTIWSNKAADVATLNDVEGALSLALASIVCIVTFRLRSPSLRFAEGSAPKPFKAAVPLARPAAGAASD